MARPRFLPDNFTLALITTVVIASLLPCRGSAASAFDTITTVAIALLFFLHGAKLSREAIVAGATHWRLHLLVLASTFVMFPIIGLLLRPVFAPLVTPELYAGVLFLCVLPSTVQSSIAFTSIARGNVSAAVCSASASSFIGIFLTPLLANVVVNTQSSSHTSALDSIFKIVLQLLVPFIVGHLSRRWTGRWIERNKGVLKFVDQGSILLVVYTAFSEAVVEGLWHHVSPLALLMVVVLCCVLLAIALFMTGFAAKRLGFNRADQITIVFCGSKKSLAAGIPMAKVIFASNAVGAVVLPLMLFHQIQLMTCAVLAQRWGARQQASSGALASSSSGA
jgi:solute carrier family 10 (sodium/bile acid cotransporter), member 7